MFHKMVSLLLQPPSGRMRCPTEQQSDQQHIVDDLLRFGFAKDSAEQLQMPPSQGYQAIATLVLVR